MCKWIYYYFYKHTSVFNREWPTFIYINHPVIFSILGEANFLPARASEQGNVIGSVPWVFQSIDFTDN